MRSAEGRQTALVIAVVVTLVGSTLTPIAVTASGESGIGIDQQPESATVAPGDTIQITVALNAESYNSPAIELGLPDGWTVVEHSDDGGEYKDTSQQWVWLNSGNRTVTYTVKVPADAEPGTYDLVANGSAIDPATNNFVFTEDETTVTVESKSTEIAPFSKTDPLPPSQSEPRNMAGMVRVEQSQVENVSLSLVQNTSDNVTFTLSGPESAANVTFYLQATAIESTQDLEDVTMYLDGERHSFTVVENAGPGKSPFIAFTIPHFSTRTITFSAESTSETVNLTNARTSSGLVNSSREPMVQSNLPTLFSNESLSFENGSNYQLAFIRNGSFEFVLEPTENHTIPADTRFSVMFHSADGMPESHQSILYFANNETQNVTLNVVRGTIPTERGEVNYSVQLLDSNGNLIDGTANRTLIFDYAGEPTVIDDSGETVFSIPRSSLPRETNATLRLYDSTDRQAKSVAAYTLIYDEATDSFRARANDSLSAGSYRYEVEFETPNGGELDVSSVGTGENITVESESREAVWTGQSPSTATVRPGETVQFTVYLNASNYNSPGLDLDLPANWTIINYTDDGGEYKSDTQQWVWLNGGNKTITYTVEAPADASNGTYSLIVNGSAIDPDTNTFSSDESVSTVTVESERTNDTTSSPVGMTQTPTENSVSAGETVQFTATLNATGLNSPALDVDIPSGWTIVDHTDDEATYKSDTQQWVWLDGGEKSVTYTVNIPADASVDAYQIVANGSAIDPETDSFYYNRTVSSISVMSGDTQSPTADFTVDGTPAVTNEIVTLDASASSDDTGIANYTWMITRPDNSVVKKSGETASLTVTQSGEYQVRLNVTDAAGHTSTTMSSFTALAPPSFDTDYSINTTTLLTNESAAVTATIENTGDLSGSVTVNFTVNGSVVASENVTVAGQSSKTISYVPELVRGTHTVGVNGKEPTRVEVRKPADINVVTRNVTTEEFLSTNPLNVTVYLNNTGDLDGTTTVPINIDGETVAMKTVSVPANTVNETNSKLKAVQFSIERNWETYGDHTVRAGELREESIIVLRPTNPDTTLKLVSPPSGSVQSSSDVTIEYTVDNANTGVSVIDVQIDDGEWRDASRLTSYEELADGDHTARVRVIDNLGNTMATAKTTFTVDTQAPNVSVQTQGPASSNNPADITVTSNDRTQNTTTVEIRDDGTTVYRTDVSDEVISETDGKNTSLTTWDGTNQSGAAVPSGTYTMAVISTDEAGNTNETTTTIVADTDRPEVNVTDVQAGDESGTKLYVNESDELTITLETSDPTTSVNSTRALIRSRTSSFQAFESAAETSTTGEWKATVDVSELGGSGNYSVGGLVTDEAQNVRPRYNDTVTIVVDETSPTMGTTVTQADETTGRMNISSSEPLNSTPEATVRLPNGTTQTVTLTETERGWTGTFSLPEDGSYQVTVSGTDRTGSVGETQASTNIQTNINTNNNNATIRNEETGTFIELHTENDVNKAFAALTESDSPLATLSENLTGSQFIDGELGKQLNDNLTYAVVGMPVDESELPDGVEPEDVEIRFYNETTGEWETVSNTTTEEREFNGTTKRFYTVNVSHFSTYGAVATDDTAPSMGETSLSPTGSPYDYDTETASVQFNYSDSQSGVDTSEAKVWVDGELVTDSQSPDTTLQVTSDSTTVELSDLVGSGEHTVTVQVVDEAGNTASNTSKTFTVEEDTTSPSVSTDFASGTTFDYGTSEVAFQLDLSDTQSGVDASGITVTVDGVDVTNSATVTESDVSYTATELEPGSHNFTVVISDEESNVKTITRTFTIDADTDAPAIDTASVSPTPDSGFFPADTTKLTLSTDYSDVESGVVASTVVVEFNDGSGWTDVTDAAVVTKNTTSYTAYDLKPGTYTFRVTVSDAAGNTNVMKKQVTIGEGTAPSFTGVDLDPDTGSDPLPANTSEVTIDIGFSDDEGDIDSIDAQFDGKSVSVVRNGGEVSYTATGLEAGTNHTLTVSIADRGGHTITETVAFQIAEEPAESTSGSSGSSGGGGGGGASSGSNALSLNVVSVSNGATIQVRDAAIGATGTANLGNAASGSGVTVNSIGLAMKFDSSRFRVEVSTPTADGPTAPKGTTISSFSVNAIGVDQSNIDSQTITFSVDESALSESASLNNVALFVKTDSGWERVSISQNGGTFTAQTDTLGTFAVTALTDAGKTSTETATTSETSTATANPSDTESGTASQTDQAETSETTQTDSPGFGITQGIMALAAALLVIRRWSR